MKYNRDFLNQQIITPKNLIPGWAFKAAIPLALVVGAGLTSCEMDKEASAQVSQQPQTTCFIPNPEANLTSSEITEADKKCQEDRKRMDALKRLMENKAELGKSGDNIRRAADAMREAIGLPPTLEETPRIEKKPTSGGGGRSPAWKEIRE